MAQAPSERIQLHLLQRAELFAESTNNFRDKTRPCLAINTHRASRAANPRAVRHTPWVGPTPDVASQLFSVYAVEAS